MGHAISNEKTTDLSSASSQTALVTRSEDFEVIPNSDRRENMSQKQKSSGKRPLLQTWSWEVKSERMILEEKHTELKPVFLGFKHCKDTLENKKKRDERYFGEINTLLKEKVIGKFSLPDLSEDEQRQVMGNKLAEIGYVFHQNPT